MASAHRERKFEEYRNRMFNAKQGFKKGYIMLMAVFAGSWIALFLYHFIKGLALLAGGGMFFGQMILNYATGKDDELPLQFETFYGLMLFLFVVALLATLSKVFKKKIFSTLLTVAFIGAFIFGLVCLYFKIIPVLRALILMASAVYGFWCNDYMLRQYKEFEFLSKQEGYPDFIDLIGEPVPIANTRGIYLRQYEKLKENADKRKEARTPQDLNDSCVDINDYLKKGGESDIPADAMDELTTDFSDSIDELLKNAK